MEGVNAEILSCSAVSYCVHVIILQLERFEVLEQFSFPALSASLLSVSLFRYFRRVFHPVTCRTASAGEVGQTGIRVHWEIRI